MLAANSPLAGAPAFMYNSPYRPPPAATTGGQTLARQQIDLNALWRFQPDPGWEGERAGYPDPGYDHRRWREVLA